tara:strand:- start:566 stop:1057 length:492 start_codon:yes stop_codon:yes gene_type:complete
MKDKQNLWQMMLKDTEYADILHEGYPTDIEGLLHLLHGLDFVVKSWLEDMIYSGADYGEQIAVEVQMQVMSCRFAIADYFMLEKECPELRHQTSYLQVLAEIRKLKQAFIKLAKPYAKANPPCPFLSNWYLDLPIKVQSSFKYIHGMQIQSRVDYERRGELFK